MQILEVLRRPIITEKNTRLIEQDKYAFEVARSANKKQIKEAVEKAFNVNVVSVNVMSVPGKARGAGKLRGKTKSWKKAVVTLEPRQRIDIFEGV